MPTTKKTAIEIRRCKGSERFGIEPHDAPISDFPVQPSRKDSLGVMCSVHWKQYVKGLTADRKARAATDEGAAIGAAVDAAIAHEAAKGRAPRRSAKKAATTKRVPTARDIEVQQAEALIAAVDALPGPEHAKRVGDPDVQAALETVNGANGGGRETPMGDAIDSGTEEADAA